MDDMMAAPTNGDQELGHQEDFAADDDGNFADDYNTAHFGDDGGQMQMKSEDDQYYEDSQQQDVQQQHDELAESEQTNEEEMKHQPADTTIEPTGRDYTSSEYYQQMLSYGVAENVIGELIEMIDAGLLKHEEVEERLFESVKTLRPDHCAFILRKFRQANLMGINNIPAYLGSLLKNFKERIRSAGEHAALAQPVISAPPVEKIKPLMDRSGYSLEVTIGQRKYGGPPPGWGDKPVPGGGHELYIGKLPRDVMEDELIPLFEECGEMYDLRLMMDPVSGYNKGYAFVTYVDKASAKTAEQKFEGYEIRKGKRLRVNVSVANTRLFIGNIPKNKGKDEIYEEFTKNADVEGILEVIIYASPDEPERKKNRGFCFLEFVDHRAASQAKRRLASGRIRLWNAEPVVDWAEPQEEPDESVMSQVKVVYVKPLKEAVTEDELKDRFQEFGEIERVKKIKDYAFIHYTERESALKAIEALNGTDIGGNDVNCSLARPPSDNKKKHTPKTGPGGSGFNRGRGGGAFAGGRGRGGGGMAPASGDGGYYGGRGSGYGSRGGGGGGYGYGAGGDASYGGGGEYYDYGGGDYYGAGGGGYDQYGYTEQAGGDWYDTQQGAGYMGYYDSTGAYGQAPPSGYPPAPAHPPRGGRGAMPRGGPRGRGGIPVRGSRGAGGYAAAGASRGVGFGGGGRGGYPARGAAGPSPRGGGGGGYRGGPPGAPMKRKSDFDTGGAKRRPGPGGPRGAGGRGSGWPARGGGGMPMHSMYQAQNWSSGAADFAEDTYS